MAKEYDVILAGAGHNGLVVASYLAKAGLNVCVVEKQDYVGGGCVTREVTLPGFKQDIASTAHSMIQTNPLIWNDELKLKSKYGLKYYLHPPEEPVTTFIFGDGREMCWYRRNIDKTCESIEKFSKFVYPFPTNSIEDYYKMHDDLDHGIPRTEMPICACTTRQDPTRAPAGKHTFYLMHYEPYRLKGGSAKWDEIKQEVADGVLQSVRNLTTNMGPENILGRWVSSPLDYERWNPSWIEGDYYHIGMLLDQQLSNRPLPGWGNYRTPVEGLYMCGSSTPPGGTISGGGRAAVQVVMEDLGIDFEEVIFG